MTIPTRTTTPAPAPAQAAKAAPSGPTTPSVTFTNIIRGGGHRILLYGPGGIGKTTLAAAMPGPVAVIDLDESLGRLMDQLETKGLADDLAVVSGAMTWRSIRAALQAPGWDRFKTIVIDTGTKAEELAVAEVLATVPIDGKGTKAQRIEDYGFGKGLQHVYETFLALLGDIDRHCRAGRHVCIIAHECVATFPNPVGEDWIRYEPRLQSPTSGKGSIRHRLKEWSDHTLFLGYDVAVVEGKGRSSGSRTLWPTEQAFCIGKSRTCSTPLVVTTDNGAAVWEKILI